MLEHDQLRSIFLKSVLMFLIVSAITQTPIKTHLITSTTGSTMDSEPLIVRITNIEWNLTTLYKEYNTLNITLNLTIVYFNVEIEIWNPSFNTKTVEFPDSDEFSPIIDENLENKSLDLTPFWGSLTVITPRNYTTGVITKSFAYPFSFEKPGLTQLPNGIYRMDLKIPTTSGTDVRINTYGLDINATDEGHSIEYDPFPYESTDINVSYMVTSCECENYSNWNEGKVNVTVENQTVYFEQIFISWCNFDKQSLEINVFQVGETLIIQEDYSSAIITDCLCAYQVVGQISNLEEGNYSLIFHYQTLTPSLQVRFTSLFPISISAGQDELSHGIVVQWELIPIFLGILFSVELFGREKKRRK